MSRVAAGGAALKAPAIKIDHGVPMPPKRGAAVPYPFWDMKRGDSFFLPCADADEQKRLGSRVSSNANNFGKRNKCRFTTRRVTEGEQLGVRCWRVE